MPRVSFSDLESPYHLSDSIEAVDHFSKLIADWVDSEIIKEITEESMRDEIKKPEIGATCTWGDGPDVMVTLKDKPYILYEDPSDHDHFMHGVVWEGSFDLTAKEALDLASRLQQAAFAAMELDRTAIEYEKREKMKNKSCTCVGGTRYIKADANEVLRCVVCKGRAK